MNYLVFGLFFLYALSVLMAGMGIYQLLNPRNEAYVNHHVFSAEVLLLGAIVLVGEMLLLALFGLYRAMFLWGAVIFNFGFLFSPLVRANLRRLFFARQLDGPSLIFLLLLAVYLFRNSFFLVDIDSHNVYLYAQKLWLAHGTSRVGDEATSFTIFTPHFNAVPYALGLALFPTDLLFPQLIVAFWGAVVLLLVFGVGRHFWNGWYALAGVMFVLFNEHFFYSGINRCCIVNNALAAFLFAAAWNFWEGRGERGQFRFVLGTIFLWQLLGNKYQVLWVFAFILMTGLLIQNSVSFKLREIASNRRYSCGIVGSIFVMSLWYVKNFLVTGIPTFPIFAARWGVFHWTSPMATVFNRVFVEPLSLPQFLKYMSYLFIWPGIDALKIVIVATMAFPLILLALKPRNIAPEGLTDLGYWLSVSLLVVLGICLVSFNDPRNYRYGLAVFAIAAIGSLNFLLREVMGIKKEILIALIMIFISARNISIVWQQEGEFRYPTLAQNVAVLMNRIHFEDVVDHYYPQNQIVFHEYQKDEENIVKFHKGAWDVGVGGVTTLSAFLLPIRPQVGLWRTTVVKWDSYPEPAFIVRDLKDFGIEWIMRVEDRHLRFLSLEEYAQEAAHYDRFPKTIFYNYNFPPELTKVDY